MLRISISLVLLIILAGCSTPTPLNDDPVPKYFKQEYRSTTIPQSQFEESRIALGGVVVRDGVDIHRNPDLPPLKAKFDHATQTKIWCQNVEWKFAQKFSTPTLMPFSEFDEFIPDSVLKVLWADFAQGGYMEPEILESIRAEAPEVRYMIMVRVDYDRVAHDIDTAWLIEPNQAGGSGNVSGSAYNPDKSNNSLHPTIQRRVGLTMDLFDLETGLTVWEGRKIKDVKQHVDPQNMNDYGGYKSMEIEAGQFSIAEEDQHQDAPPFYMALEKCLGSLFKDMDQILE